LPWAEPIFFFLISPGHPTRHFSRTGPPPRSRRSPAPALLDPAPPRPGPTAGRTPLPRLRAPRGRHSPPIPPFNSRPSLHFLLSTRADGTQSKPPPPSPPLVACSSTPTVGAPPLTGNLAAPPASSPLLGESRPHASFPPTSSIELGPHLSLTLTELQVYLGASSAAG
jgi:hypothetical protein